MPDVSPPTRKRRSFLRFSLRTFLIATLVIGALLGPFVYKTRKQAWVADQLAKQAISTERTQPPAWLSFLPPSILNYGSGHWCTSIDKVYLDLEQSTPENWNKLKSTLTLLTELPRLNSLQLRLFVVADDPGVLKETLRPLADIPGLQHLNLMAHQDYDPVLDAIPCIPNLRSFKTSASGNMSAKSLGQLSKFPELEMLSLSNGYVGVISVQPIAALANLKYASLNYAIPPWELHHFAGHSKLERLYHLGLLNDEGIVTLCSCPNLRAISAVDCYVTDDGFSNVTKLHHLEEIKLNHPSITDSGFARLAQCKSLKQISIQDCKLTDAIASTLIQLPQLKSVGLRSTLVTEKLIPKLYSNPQLCLVDLGQTPVNVDTVFPLVSRIQTLDPKLWDVLTSWRQVFYRLGKLPSLPTGYYFNNNLHLPNLLGLKGKVAQAKDLSSVTNIDLSNTDINDSDLHDLAAAANLNFVNVANSGVSAAGLQSLSRELELHDLIVGPFDNPDAAIAPISNFNSLKNLTFSGADRLTPTSLGPLANLTKLEVLDLSDCDYDEALAVQLSVIPKLAVIRWHAHETQAQHLEALRLKLCRQAAGVPGGLQMRLKEKPNLSNVTIVDESELAYLRGRFFSELSVSGVKLTPEGLGAIQKTSRIAQLDVSDTGITDDDIKQLAKSARGLWGINLSNNPLTDAAIDHLLTIPELSVVSLAGTKVTDDGITRLIDSSARLRSLDVSNTAITDQAWLSLQSNVSHKLKVIKMNNVSSLGKIFRTIPIQYFNEATIYSGNEIQNDMKAILVMQGGQDPSSLSNLTITPDLLNAWPVQELFAKINRLNSLSIHSTGQFADVLQQSQRASHTLYELEIHRENLAAQPVVSFPKDLRSLRLHHCDLNTDALIALSKCPWLRTLELTDCKLGNTSIEPLLQMRQLAYLKIYSITLSPDQTTIVERLRPALIETNVRP